MISEAASNGSASVAILSLKRKDAHNKFDDFISALVSTGYARRYSEGAKPKKTAKYDLGAFVRGIKILGSCKSCPSLTKAASSAA